MRIQAFVKRLLLVGLALTGYVGSAFGGTLAVTPSGISDAVDTRSYTTGWAFTTSQGFTVTALGYYDSGQNGLLSSHDVGIFTAGGTLLVSATVPSGTAGTLNGVYRTVAISPFALAAGSYVIGGASIDSADPITVTAAISPIAGISVTDITRFDFAGSLVFPAQTGGAQYMNPDFEVGATGVPEPATCGLVLIALAGTVLWKRVAAR